MERHPKSTPGDFYIADGECLACGIPHVIAPELIGWVDENRSHCYWKKQPETAKELERAISVLDAQELGCHRYAGDDPAILRRVHWTNCDHAVRAEFKRAARIDVAPPTFSLLDDRPSWFSRILKMLRNTVDGA